MAFLKSQMRKDSKLQDIPNYELIEETEPVILTKGKLHEENCGYLKYKRKS